MLTELKIEASNVERDINMPKTKIIIIKQQILSNNKNNEIIDSYVYLSKKFIKNSQNLGIKRQIMLSWAACGERSYVMKMKIRT